MASLGIFVACLAGIVLVAVVANWMGGAKAHYLETLAFDPDERELWRDGAADAHVVLQVRAASVSYSRLRRHAVVVTSRRIIVAAKTLFGGKHMIQYVLYAADGALPPEAAYFARGLTARGYQTLVFERLPIRTQGDGARAYVDLEFAKQLAGSLAWFRIYSTKLDSFVLPE